MGYTQAQIDAMTGAQWAALGGPVPTDAPYVTGLNVPGYGPIPSGGSLPTLPSLGDLGGPQNNAASINAATANMQTGVNNVASAASSVGSALSFITNIPRVTTTVLGLILIIAGIFALTKGQTVIQVARSAVP